MSAQPAPAALELIDVVKSYPGVRALNSVSLRLRAGELHALAGENGAGKSTIVKVLAGIEQPDAGSIRVAGQPALLASPLQARRAGIAVVHQELSLLPHMTIASNLLLGREELVSRFGIANPSRRRQAVRAMLKRLGLTHDPEMLAGALPISEQQLVEIARALSEDAKVILMDEPTAALTPVEAESLFAKIVELKASGVAILYITHRLDEIKRLADQVTVLRDGVPVLTGPAEGFTVDQIITAMVGRTISDHYPRREERLPGAPILEVTDAAAFDCGGKVSVRAGEIVGLAGLVGSGRSEWACDLFSGTHKCAITLHGRALAPKSPYDSRAVGIGLVPGDRKVQGLCLDLNVRENLTLTVLDRLAATFGFLAPARVADAAKQLIARLDIRCANDAVLVRTLSGGNQQKITMAKWLARECSVLILDEPTRGIDIGAKEEIYRLILQMARDGKSVLLVSSELPELLSLCDRIYVMRKGRFVADLDARKATQEQIVALA